MAPKPTPLVVISSLSSRSKKGRVATNKPRVDTASVLGTTEKVCAPVCFAFSLELVGELTGGLSGRQRASENSAVGLASLPLKNAGTLTVAVGTLLTA